MEKAIQRYINSYTKICPNLTQEELDFIKKRVTVTELQNKEFYLKSGDIQKEMGFVFQGLLRSFYVDSNGNEITIAFIQEDSYAADYSVFITQKPSKFYIQCLEPCIMVNLPYISIQDAYLEFKNFEKYGRLIAESILVNRQNRIESFLFENAKERYLNFANQNPNLLNRISLTHLSSYLGVERQSLSRIRNKLV